MDFMRFATGMRGALYQCGQVARRLRGRVETEHKEPDSVHQRSTAISVVDRLCQEILFLRAHELAPGIEIASEEMEDLPAEVGELFARNRHRYALVLDPVDGSEDYVRGQETYGHMLALLDQETGRVAAGMVYFSELLRLYLGVRGMGAFVSDGLWGGWRLVQPDSPPRTVGRTKRITEGDYRAMEGAGYTTVPAVSRSAAWELMRVVRGELGAMVMRHFHGHDTAPISVILEALGGLALDGDGRPVRFVKEMPRSPVVVLSVAPGIARELAELLPANAGE
jgi:fructose-1,6-bisphosphatase/inositol monophosphatase family enzyme